MGFDGEYGPLVIRWLCLAGAVLAPAPALACRLALLLALDVSSSVDAREYELQRNGLAAALIAPEVQRAFLDNPVPVALAAYEWSGRFNQEIILHWTMIRTSEDLARAADRIVTAPRSSTGFQTALGHALGYAARYFPEGPACASRTIDVSGDGESNHGFSPRVAYQRFPLAGVTVNALAIGASVGLDNLEVYYRTELIKGPGAFVELAADYEDFQRAMARKLEREVTSLAIGAR